MPLHGSLKANCDLCLKTLVFLPTLCYTLVLAGRSSRAQRSRRREASGRNGHQRSPVSRIVQLRRVTSGSVVYYQFHSLADVAGLAHGAFTRLGGASRAPWDGLNTGHTVGDDDAAVEHNHRLIADALGVARSDVVSPHQVHGTAVAVVTERDRGRVIPQTDALVTRSPNVPLMLRFADCAPLFFYDPVQRAVGLAHAGWRGTVAGVGRATVEAMVGSFGSRPGDLLAGIGPAIGVCCYEVGEDVAQEACEAFPSTGQPEDRGPLASEPNGRWHLDLWAANRRQLEESGVRQIEVAGTCTSCHTEEWFSHRAEKGRTGRWGAAIGLRERGTP